MPTSGGCGGCAGAVLGGVRTAMAVPDRLRDAGFFGFCPETWICGSLDRSAAGALCGAALCATPGPDASVRLAAIVDVERRQRNRDNRPLLRPRWMTGNTPRPNGE